ncbi:MAG: nitroreductase/quinone reductase family protein [Actinomycetes bacterium]
MSSHTHYVKPSGSADNLFQRAVTWLTRHGVSVYGSRILRVQGRASGLWREVPVNPLVLDGRRYLVAPRGQTQWVRNLRAAGQGELRLGRSTETFTAVELPDGDKVQVLRHYLRRWGFEVGRFFDGVTAKAPDSELQRIAGRHPVFEITVTSSTHS